MKFALAAALLALALAGCSSVDNNDPDTAASVCEEHLNEDDGAGQSCDSSEDCPPVDCPCDDGSMTTVASCASGSCQGREGCAGACEAFDAEYQCAS